MPRKKRIPANDPMSILAEATLQDQAEKRLEKENKKRAREVALKQMKAAEDDAASRQARLQKICDHLLGNHRIGVKPRFPMSALHKDYLSDKTVRIYCGKCRAEWHPGDTAEFMYTRGAVIMKSVNHTGKSWKEINEFFYSFENAADLTSRAFRLERVEPENIDMEEQRLLREAAEREPKIATG
jgi:hypothetical protein